jgi:predicted nucleic acid-binding protein
MTNIYIDSNVIVASEIEEEEHNHESREFMQYVLRNKKTDIIFFTSVFTFLELASAMTRRTNDRDKTYSLLYRIKNSWKYSINPLPPMAPRKMTSFTRLVDTLIETSIRFHTSSADSIHAQTIAENEIDYVVTWNKKDFSDMIKQIQNLKVLTPSEMMEVLNT